MAALNEAYRVLSDPGRRRAYDLDLTRPQRDAPNRPAGKSSNDAEREPLVPDGWVDRDSFLAPAGPARFPWKSAAVAAVVGSIVVFVSAMFSGSPSVDPPDGIIEPGSCVEILANFDVSEVQCRGTGDRVVRSLVPTNSTCPADTESHRDRLGLGTACLYPDPVDRGSNGA